MTTLNQQPPSGPAANMVIVELNQPYGNHTCTTAPGFYFYVTDDASKRLFSTILAAYMAGKSVKIHAAGTCGTWDYELLDGVVVEP